ncbi:MAG: cob(I)yrinic acid a,c-diamide adenosyltransferase, partial [Betaproteobacteria bacterium]|nr:cob(I)yrinic acid a,c-diamide adenosyltransferase [Betaproteobacteria bacterium]
LIRLLAGTLAPSRGSVCLDGRDLRGRDRRTAARNIASVAQRTEVGFDVTTLEYALQGRHPHLGRFELEGQRDLDIAERALSRTGTNAFASRSLVALSGGEQQRVFVARGLTQEPRVLLVDEPTANLDLANQLRVMEVLRRLASERGLAVLLALHDLGLVARYADRLVLLANGRIVAQGEPSAVLDPAALRATFGVPIAVRWDAAGPSVTVGVDAVLSPISEPTEDAPLEDLSEEGRARKRAEQAGVRQHPERRAQGLVIVNTGNGKGKTTAALGLVLRAWGRDLKVVMFQFIKAATANWGESRAAARVGIEMVPLGAGFTWMSQDVDRDRALAQDGWRQARERILSGTDDVVVLDELTYLLKFGWIETGDVIATLRERRPLQHVVITGRDAPADLVGFADLVTEMRQVKHPYQSGVKAQPGIEF